MNEDFIEKLKNSNIIDVNNSSCSNIEKELITKLNERFAGCPIPENNGSDSKISEKCVKDFFKNSFESVFIDPNGSQKPPDVRLDFLDESIHIELKSCKSSFCFNDSIINDDYYYIFIKSGKIFVIRGNAIPQISKEYIEDIILIREKWKKYFQDDKLYSTYARLNIFLKSEFMRYVPVISFYNGEGFVIKGEMDN